MRAASHAPLNKSLALMFDEGLTPYACECGWLERAADDPSVPIGFDSQVNEYYLKAGSPCSIEGQYVIHYCPSCGGSAPPSHRDSLFVVVTPDERMRLQESWSTLRTRDEVLRTWGPPDEEIPDGYGETEPEREGKPSRTVNFDVMRYNNLSETAVVDVVVCAGGRVMFTYCPKAKLP